MTYQVVIRNVEAQPIAAVRRTATRETLGPTIQEGLGEVWNHVRRHPPGAPGRNIVVYLEGLSTLDIGVEIQPPFSGTDSVHQTATPAGTVAMTVHHGPHTTLSEAHRAVLERCTLENRRLAGPSWEVYGHWTDDESQFTIEVFYLLSQSEEPEAG